MTLPDSCPGLKRRPLYQEFNTLAIRPPFKIFMYSI